MQEVALYLSVYFYVYLSFMHNNLVTAETEYGLSHYVYHLNWSLTALKYI